MQIRKYFLGVAFTIIVAFASIAVAKNFNALSPLLVAIFFGIALGFLGRRFCVGKFSESSVDFGVSGGKLGAKFGAQMASKLELGVTFSAKKLLRLGIILYGFYITLDEIALAGVWGILACGVCIFITLFLGLKLAKVLGVDKNLAILVAIGTAICGAAAILACAAAIKDDKNAPTALGVIVVLGLMGMFAYPLGWELGLSGIFSQAQMGFFAGLSLHEVANVVGAAGAIGDGAAQYGIVAKMIRVLYLAPVLVIVALMMQKSQCGADFENLNSEKLDSASLDSQKSDFQNLNSQNACKNAPKRQKTPLYIPYFALAFLGVVALNSFVDFGVIFVEICKFASVLCLSAAMCALGLQIELKSFKNAGGKAFALGVILSIILISLAFGITIFLGANGVI